MSEEIRPEHLDYWSRNDRLYRRLLSLGLWVEPIFVKGSPFADDIDYLLASVGHPTTTSAGESEEA